MPVTIQDVIDYVLKAFTDVQLIPRKNIRYNPKNHGWRITPEQTQKLADNLAVNKLINPVKVMIDPVNPLVPGVQIHPTEHGLRGDGQPWTLEDFNYLMLAGENRDRAYGLLKRDHIPGYILNPTPQEANEIMWLDNETRDRGWWAAYQAIEDEIIANPNLTMQQVASNLNIDRDKVSRALRLLPLMSQKTRDLLCGVSALENKEILDLGEMATARLGDLGPYLSNRPGWNLKAREEGQDAPKLYPYPPIPPETQDLVHRAMLKAGEHDMSESQVKGLVAHIQEGGAPEDYRPSVKPKAKKKTLPDKAGEQATSGPRPKAEAFDLSAPSPETSPPTPETRVVSPPTPSSDVANPTPSADSKIEPANLKNGPERVASAQGACATGAHKHPWIKAVGNFLLWVGKHLWHYFLKHIHQYCKDKANQMVPLHHSSSSQGQSGRDPLKTLAHWAVYRLFLFISYGLLITAISTVVGLVFHSFGHWVYVWGICLLKLVFIQLPVWFLVQGLNIGLLALVLGVGILVWIILTYKPNPLSILLYAGLLFGLWWFRGVWLGWMKLPVPTKSQPKPLEMAQASAGKIEPPAASPIATVVIYTPPPPAKPKQAAKAKVTIKKVVSATQNSTAPVASPPVSSPAPKTKIESDSDFVLNFAQALYSIGYQNYQDRETTLLGWVTKDYTGDLKGHYFNPYVLKNMISIQRTKAFTPDAPVKWVFSNETTEEFIVSGTIVGQAGWNGQGLNFTKKVKSHIQIIHDLSGKILVKNINEHMSDE